jgi:hypothetical protein
MNILEILTNLENKPVENEENNEVEIGRFNVRFDSDGFFTIYDPLDDSVIICDSKEETAKTLNILL